MNCTHHSKAPMTILATNVLKWTVGSNPSQCVASTTTNPESASQKRLMNKCIASEILVLCVVVDAYRRTI